MADFRLSDVPEDQRDDFMGAWFELVSDPSVIGIYEGAYLGAKLKVPNLYEPIYTEPDNLLLRNDLARAWDHEGNPIPKGAWP